MDVDAHVAALEREGLMLVEAARRADPRAPVPACPGWQVADLLAHIGFVHRWAAGYVATARTEMAPEPDEQTVLKSAPPESERAEWVAEGHAALVRALQGAPPDLVCWTFLDAPSPLAMWARRQAHETAVHRVDVELACGSDRAAVDPDLAVDGIDELLFAFFGRPTRRRGEVPGGAVRIGLDAGTAEHWTVRVDETGVGAWKGREEGDVAVRIHGTPSDLYLLLWHRRPLEGLDVEGPGRLFEQVWSPHGVTWS